MAEVENTTSDSKRRNLTDKYIASLKPTAKRVTYWDATEPGLGIQVTPTGHKSFIVVRRIRGGGPTKYVIRPPYPTTTLATAREKAAEVNGRSRTASTFDTRNASKMRSASAWPPRRSGFHSPRSPSSTSPRS